MNPDEVKTVKDCLDMLAFKLAEYHPSWTTKDRQLYEKAIRILEEHGG